MICSIVSIVDDDLWFGIQWSTFSIHTDKRLSASNRLRNLWIRARKNTCCLITDQQLPGLSGADLQKYLHAAGYRTPVIFITP
jgi:FixJ family two-component response regulator